MDNITVKAANGTTDVVYTGISPSPGDGVPARWRAEASSDVIGWRRRFQTITKPASRGTARHIAFRAAHPVVRTENGVQVLKGILPLEINATVGENFTSAEIDEAILQSLNAAGVALIRTVFRSGINAS